MGLGCLLWDHGLRVAWAIALRLLWSALVVFGGLGCPGWIDVMCLALGLAPPVVLDPPL